MRPAVRWRPGSTPRTRPVPCFTPPATAAQTDDRGAQTEAQRPAQAYTEKASPATETGARADHAATPIVEPTPARTRADASRSEPAAEQPAARPLPPEAPA